MPALLGDAAARQAAASRPQSISGPSVRPTPESAYAAAPAKKLRSSVATTSGLFGESAPRLAARIVQARPDRATSENDGGKLELRQYLRDSRQGPLPDFPSATPLPCPGMSAMPPTSSSRRRRARCEEPE